MTNGASATLTLEARIPNPAMLTGLLDELAGRLGEVNLPGLPTAQIGQLAGGLALTLPDTSRWSDLAVPDAGTLLARLPDPAALAAPLQAPLDRVQSFLSADLGGDLARVREALAALSAGRGASPRALVEGLVSPLESIGELVRDAELTRLLVALGGFLGLGGLERLPADVSGFLARIQQLVQERVGGTLLAIAAVSAAATLLGRGERQVALAAGLFSPGETQARLQAVLDQLGSGPGSLAAELRGLEPGDAARVAAVRARLSAAGEAFAAYHGRLTRDLAQSEAALLLVDTDALAAAAETLRDTLAGASPDLIIALGASLDSLLQRLRGALSFDAPLDMAGLRALVTDGLARVRAALAELDPGALSQVLQEFTSTVTAPFQQIERFKAEVEALAREGLGVVEAAVRQIDLGQIRAAFDQGLGLVEQRLREVAALFAEVRRTVESALEQVRGALAAARAFVLDPEGGLKPRIEQVFGGLFELLDQLDIKGAIEQVNQVLQPIAAELGRIEFAPVIDATVEVVDTIIEVLGTVAPLLVTDDLRRKLSEATAFLREIDFAAIAASLNSAFDEILAAVDEEALGRLKEEYNKVVAAVDRLDPAPALEALQAEVFDPLIAELERFEPAQLLGPVQGAFAAASAALGDFSPAASLSFVTAFFSELTDRLGQLAPARLLAPVEAALAEVRQTLSATLRIDQLLELLDGALGPIPALLDSVDPGRLFDLLEPGYAQLREAVAAFDPAALIGPGAAGLRGIFSALGLDIDRGGVAGLVAAVSAADGLSARLAALPRPLERQADELARLDLRGTTMALRERHSELQAALALHGSAGPLQLELSAEVAALDPLVALAPISARLGRVQAAYSARLTALAQAGRSLGPALAAADTAAAALARLLNPLAQLRELIREPIRRLLGGEGADLRADLLAFLDALEPGTWRQELQAILTMIRDKVRALLGDAVVTPLRETLLALKGVVELLDLSALSQALGELFGQITATIAQLSPVPLIEAMEAAYKRVADLLEQLNPSDFIAAIDRLYREDVIGVLRAISPRELLLPSLEELFGRIRELLIAFDIELIFRPVLDQLRSLQGQLSEGLGRAGASFERMVDALDSAGASASVSVSVSVGA